MNHRITIDPSICHGKPVITGTRMPVAFVVGSLAGGMSFEEIQREYNLAPEDIRAALAFAAERIEAEQYHPCRCPRFGCSLATNSMNGPGWRTHFPNASRKPRRCSARNSFKRAVGACSTC